MTRKIIRTFTITPIATVDVPAQLYSRTDGRWSSFQNNYAVWPTTGNQVASYTIRRTFTVSTSGIYTYQCSADNSATVYLDGILLGSGFAGFNSTPTQYKISLTAGTHTIEFRVSNGGDVAGVAFLLRDPNLNEVWSTRIGATASPSLAANYSTTMPFNATVTAYLWGAGGGGGGMDAGSAGGAGSPGLFNSHTFSVQKNDLLLVSVGTAGTGGSSNTGSAPGGAAGIGLLDVASNPTKSFNGGNGSAAGPAPYSGGGGAGGGATVILKNGQTVVVAGGGAGGGGGGNDGNGAGPLARRTATISNNATGKTSDDYRGQNGQAKGGDGGGAGGGGGGYPGGLGGAVAGGDASGFAGQTGGNLPPNSASVGANNQYYRAEYAAGGQAGGGNGRPGYAVLVIEPIGIASVKVQGEWKQITDAYIKVSGTWRSITDSYVKVKGVWKPIAGSGIRDISFSTVTDRYGARNRPYGT